MDWSAFRIARAYAARHAHEIARVWRTDADDLIVSERLARGHDAVESRHTLVEGTERPRV
jgi:hypothetical protein